jgi:long-chain acyl-CoA synthetase
VSLLPLPLSHVYGLMLSVCGVHLPEPTHTVLMRWFEPAGFLRLARLSAVKYPREVRIVEQVPLTSVGKVDRRLLRQRLTPDP